MCFKRRPVFSKFVFEDGFEVDLLPAYLNFQMKGILATGKSIHIKAIEFKLPGTSTSFIASNCTTNVESQFSKTSARRTLVLQDKDLGFANVGDLDSGDEKLIQMIHKSSPT